MSEYWKSNPRKFCDFCKCWISDNKPSIEFHERGKRHKQNVQNRITEVRKSSEKKAKEKAELQNDLQKMEKAALEAFKKDLENNPALAQQYKVKTQAAREAQKLRDEKRSNKKSSEKEAEVKSLPVEDDWEGVWYEALSPEGYPYYWNDKTNEPVWEAPEKYVSLAEQELQQQQGLDEEEKEEEETATTNIPLPEDANDIPLPESPSACETSEPTAPAQPTIHKDHNSARSAYGGWETVSVAEVALPPEDLPVEDIPLPESPKEAKPVKQKFREKTVTSLSSKPGEVVAFKKRKVAAGARNTRRRDSDD